MRTDLRQVRQRAALPAPYRCLWNTLGAGRAPLAVDEVSPTRAGTLDGRRLVDPWLPPEEA